MATTYACPGCATPFNVTDKLAGKRAKCPKCALVFTMPPAAPAPEVEAEAVAAVPSLPADLFPRGDDEEPERRRPRRSRRDEEPDEDDADEPRPRRGKKKTGSSSTLVWTLVIGGVAAVLFVLCAGVIGIIALVTMRQQPANLDRPGAVAVKQGGPRPPATRVNLVNGQFSTNSTLMAADPRDPQDARFHCKLFAVPMQPGSTYTIDMQSAAFDSFLRLEDSNGVELRQDDDSGGALNARIVFVPPRADTYVIIATTFHDNSFGPFTLSVRENRPGGVMFKK